MTDPYKVLGVSQSASDEQLKAAYRELARKYHPDNYTNDPLADLAAEKMKEINEAYDTIAAERRGGNSSNGHYQQASSQFSDIRRLVSQGRIADAEELLDGVPATSRDAEWYFLKGSTYYAKGWLEQAVSCFSKACQLDPNNPEYRAALNQQMWQRGTGGSPQPYPGACTCCDLCTAFYCANCLCNCLRCG